MEDPISLLSRQDIQQFIVDNEQVDGQKLLLRHKEILGVPTASIVSQIQGRRKVKDKLPRWYTTPGIIYPPTLNLEQCSSEATAQYKKNLVRGHHIADLTGGFGVDTYYLAQSFALVDYVEPDNDLLRIAQHNHQLLGTSNIRYHNITAEDYLQTTTDIFDLMFIDPSRRQGSRKVFRLADGVPDVFSLRSELLSRSRQVLIKTSPLLDLKQAYRELTTIDQFIVLAVENECRELLISLKREAPKEPTIHAVDLDKDGEPTPFAFTWAQEKNTHTTFSTPLTYLYEPNTAILKAGAFKQVGHRYSLHKLAPDTHLFTSENRADDFPGRLFKVIEHVALDKKLKEKFSGGYANILTRNHPLSVEEIKKKTGLEEGGTRYLICARTEKKPIAMIAERLR